jgi:RNA polymerase sigma factor (sigma-70 family)
MASQPEGQQHDEQERRARVLGRLLATRGEHLGRQVRRHSPRVEDAEDALADACVQFMRHYTGPSSLDDALRWMLLVCKRCAWEIARQRRKRDEIAPRLSLDEVGEGVVPTVNDAAELVERGEEVNEVTAAIDGLAPDERAALLLFGLGFSYQEIAARQGWSYAKVHRRLSDGRARVRRMLEGGDSS